MSKVFASYHFLINGTIQNGFGNYIGEFDMEGYRNEPEHFILDLEKAIKLQLEEHLNVKNITVKILFFK